MDKEDVVYTYKDVCVCVCTMILLSHKKNKIMPFAATCMDPETIILSEVRQTGKTNII